MLFPTSVTNFQRLLGLCRTCNPFCTALLFTSGKLVVTGVQSFYECILASLSIMKIINMVYPMQSFQVYNCVVQNMVAHSTFNLQNKQKFDIQVCFCLTTHPIRTPYRSHTEGFFIAGNVRTHASRLYISTKYVSWAHLQSKHMPSRGAVFLFGESGVDWWKNDGRHLQRMADNMGHQQTFHQMNRSIVQGNL